MTLEAIAKSDKEFLIPEDIASVLGCKPYSISSQAQADATKLGFPVTVMGSRVRIPRKAFLYWMEFGNAPVNIPS